MRLLGKINNQKKAYEVASALRNANIQVMVDGQRVPQVGTVYQVWIVEEDTFLKAQEIYKQIVTTQEEVQLPPPEEANKASAASPPKEAYVSNFQKIKEKIHITQNVPKEKAPVTKFIILLCVILFGVQFVQMDFLGPKEEKITAQITPIDQALFFDYPTALQQEGKTPMWSGMYYVMLHWPKSKIDFSAPMFEKISQGQVWRLFTPCLLHGGVLHILFNMIFLWILGKQVEFRIKAVRYLALTLVVGIGGNVFQYLMSGFAFVGYSGIICGLAAFIWVRQHIAPWEGYPLEKGTALFLLIFVVGISVLQVISFSLNYFHIAQFPLHIANTAHISGAILGAILARISPLFGAR